VLDPDEAPGEVRRLGIDPVSGGIAVSHRGTVERATTATEQDVTAAMARLLRGHAATVCYATGHGEPAVDDQLPEGFSEAANLLRDNGYTIRVVDLLAQPAVPSGCQALFLVSPTAPLGPAEPAVSSWLAADGKLLLLADPVSSVDLGPVLKPYGLGIMRGIVYEGEPEAALPGDPTSPIVRRYSSASPIVRRLPPTYFPGAEEVTVDDPRGRGGLTVSRLADTSEISYLETEPLASQFDPGRDRRGPITVAGAADLSRVEGSTVKRTRVAVVGDADFASNAFVNQAGNAKLLVQAVDWLTLEEDLIALSTNLPSDRPLRLTRARERYALLLSAGVVPGFFLLAGGFVWALRRAR
jgi:hypothetical protein